MKVQAFSAPLGLCGARHVGRSRFARCLAESETRLLALYEESPEPRLNGWVASGQLVQSLGVGERPRSRSAKHFVLAARLRDPEAVPRCRLREM
jgi:hypothetical protein